MDYALLTTSQSDSETTVLYLSTQPIQLSQLIRSLPHELISEIFIWVCDVEQDPSTGLMQTTIQAMRLSHVSRFWRTIALGTPRLWTKLQVVVKRANIEPALELIKLWVPRSMSRPITICVSFKSNQGKYLLYPEDTLTLFQAITKAAALLKNIHDNRTLKEAYFESHIKAGSYGVVPTLEERYHWFSGVPRPPTPEERPSLPLTVLGDWQTVDEFGSDFHSRLRNSLTRLDLQDTNGITCVSNTELLIILGEFPFLRHLSAYVNLGDLPPSEAVVAQHLENLELSWLYITDVGPLLDQLVAPNLTELQLSGEIPAGGQWPHLLEFFRRSKPPIKQLCLRELDGRTSQLSECLSLLPNLQILWLEFCVLDDPLVFTHSHRPTLDNLQTLGLVSCENMSGDSLIQVFRDIGPTSLKELYILECPDVSEANCETLQRMFKGREVMVSTLASPVEYSE